MFRHFAEDGRMRSDILSLEGDQLEGESLIVPVMKEGRRLSPAEPLQRSRQRALAELKRLPEPFKSLEAAPAYPVTISEALKKLAVEVDLLQAHAPEQYQALDRGGVG